MRRRSLGALVDAEVEPTDREGRPVSIPITPPTPRPGAGPSRVASLSSSLSGGPRAPRGYGTLSVLGSSRRSRQRVTRHRSQREARADAAGERSGDRRILGVVAHVVSSYSGRRCSCRSAACGAGAGASLEQLVARAREARRRDDQDRLLGVVHDVRGDAAQQQRRKLVSTARAHDDQRGAELLGGAHQPGTSRLWARDEHCASVDCSIDL